MFDKTFMASYFTHSIYFFKYLDIISKATFKKTFSFKKMTHF